MEREERRRRIVSRGTDRLALITGQIQSLDLNPLSVSSSFSTRPNDHPPAQHARSSSEPVLTNEKPFLEDYHHGIEKVPDLLKHEEKEEATKLTMTSNDSIFSQIPFPNFLNSVTPKEINSSIISSENTRVICSVAIAILVLLSHVNVPHKLVKSESLICYRPLYVVLLTDVLVVAGKLAMYTQIKGDDNETKKVNEDGHNLGGAIKLLELGLVLHQALRAIFIDCSFYLVIVVCGLSLV